MLPISVLALAVGSANAAPEAELDSGDSALSACLNQTECATRATTLLGATMARQGLVLQTAALGTSALVSKGWGPVLEIRVDSAALGTATAIERSGPKIPAIPRIAGGWLLGSSTWDDPKPQLGLGATLFPSISVLGGRITTVQTDASVSLPVLGPAFWVGGELSYATASVALPLFAQEGQLDAIEQSTGLPVTRPGACDGRECEDVYRQRALSGRLGVSFEPAPAVFAFSRVALSGVRTRFEVEYDDTTWSLNQLQAQVQGGVGVRAGVYQLALGAVVVPQRSTDAEPSPALAKVVASSSWRLGPARRWTETPEASSESR